MDSNKGGVVGFHSISYKYKKVHKSLTNIPNPNHNLCNLSYDLSCVNCYK